MRDDVDVGDVMHVAYLCDQSKDVIGCCSQVASNQSNQIAPTQTHLMSCDIELNIGFFFQTKSPPAIK